MADREKLVRMICESTQKTETCSKETYHDCRTARGDCRYCTILADHLIAHGVTVQEWISVKDRLPDVGSIVLVSDNETDCRVWQYTNYSERGVDVPWMDEFGVPCKTEEITHWMPLPQPPKGE